jgi:hypothetical protein
MGARILSASGAEAHRPPVYPEGRRVTSHGPQVTSCKLFTFTHFPKNTPASPFVSHTFKTKDLKLFRFTHLQKSGGGSPHPATVLIPLALRHEGSEPAIFAADEGSLRSQSREPQPANHKSPVYPEAGRATNHESLRLTPLTSTLAKFAPASPLDSALTSKTTDKYFSCNTYEKHTGGEGGVECGGSTPPCRGQQWGQGRIFQHPTSNRSSDQDGRPERAERVDGEPSFQPPPLDAKLSHQLQLR